MADFLELKERAEQGDAEAQFKLGVAYKNADGVEEDPFEARKWFRKAAEQGIAEAQYNVALLYARGGKDYEAVKWYKRAAEQGVAEAMNNLGNAYYNGKGVEEDRCEAVRWWRKATRKGCDAYHNIRMAYDAGVEEAVLDVAEHGDVEAQMKLAHIYDTQGNPDALKWYTAAAEKGDFKAQAWLGDYYYEKGQKDTAYDWYIKADIQNSYVVRYKLKSRYPKETFKRNLGMFFGMGFGLLLGLLLFVGAAVLFVWFIGLLIR